MVDWFKKLFIRKATANNKHDIELQKRLANKLTKYDMNTDDTQSVFDDIDFAEKKKDSVEQITISYIQDPWASANPGETKWITRAGERRKGERRK